MIELRSDTFTRPSGAMRDAMMEAETGDDVYGEDPTVNALEAHAAQLTGREAALYCISGTQSNLLALLSQCQRGDEYIAGQESHIYLLEGGGASALGGIQSFTLPFNSRGELPLDRVRAAIKPDDFHFAVTRLICLENTMSGKVLSLEYLKDYSDLVKELGLRRHLDGARVFHAAVKLQVPVAQICQHFDTISICLSKGLACPVGSLLVGDRDTINRARRLRKMIGGGMRQAGIMAASGLYALENNVARLQQDHDNAAKVASALAELRYLKPVESPETNMLMIASNEKLDMSKLVKYLRHNDININGARWVFHRDISASDADRLIEVCRTYDASM